MASAAATSTPNQESDARVVVELGAHWWLLPWQRVPQTPLWSLLPPSSPCFPQSHQGRHLTDWCQRDPWIRFPFACCFCRDIGGSIAAECISWILLNTLFPCTTQIEGVIFCSEKSFNISEPTVPPDLFSGVLMMSYHVHILSVEQQSLRRK